MHRGEIWWANLPEPRQSEPGYRRPVLIIQTDRFNRSNINTIIAIVITSNIKRGEAPGNVLLPKNQTDLSQDSVVNVSQVITIDKNSLVECVGVLPSGLFQKVETGLRLILGL